MRAAASLDSSTEREPSSRLRLLVVEDNAGDASLIAESWALVPGYSFEISLRSTLGQALDALQSARFDAVVIDLSLPDARGPGSVVAIAELHPDLPIIVLSGDDSPRARREALKAGANAFIGKSEPTADLLGRYVVNAVERRHGRATAAQWERLVAVGPDAIIVVGLDGVVRFVNDATLAMFGRPRSDFLDESLGFSVREGTTSEIDVLRGTEHLVGEMRVAAVDWQGEPALLASIRDQTERRRAEAALAGADRMASMGTLAASMAHDINSPLSAVMGNLELALAGSREQTERIDVVETLQDAYDAAKRMRDIVRDLRIFARSQEATLAPTDVHAAIESTLRIARNEVRHRAELVRQLAPVPNVLANESRLGQVLLNLVVNAAQAIPEGRALEHRVTVATSCPTPGTVEIAVSDTGAGMSEETRARLFTPFFTTKAPGLGTGLGLSICDRIVRSFGGTISVESTLGRGTTFRVWLPACAVAARAVVQDLPRRPRQVGRARLFVIDDERQFAVLLERALKRDYDVVVFDAATPALERLRDGDACDAIVCDIMMPQMNGMELFSALGLSRPELRDRVIFTTGGAFTPSAREFLAAHDDRVLEKPFTIQSLREALDAVLGASPETKIAAGVNGRD